MVPKLSNLISFKIFGIPDDANNPWANQVMLTLEAPWKITAGIKPDVNVARVPWQEFEKLYASAPADGEEDPAPKKTLHSSGDVYFYYSDEFAPDVVLSNVVLIQVEPLEIGTVRVPDPADPGAAPVSIRRVVVYRLWFADFRQQLQPPRGGFLTDGEVNKDEGLIGDSVPNSELGAKCLRAMGLIGVQSPATMDLLPPIKNLNWMGAHAATELARILEYTGHVFCPNPADPANSIQRIGTGEEPTVPGDRELPELVIEGANRVEVVIVTSAPTPIFDTFDSDSTKGPQWNYVVRDEKGRWVSLDSVKEVGDEIKGQTLVNDDFIEVTDPVRRATLYDDLFRFIQIDPSAYPDGKTSLLRIKMEQEVKDVSGIIRAKDIVVVIPEGAVYAGNGKWVQSSSPIRLPAVWMSGGRNILGVHRRIGKLGVPGPVDESSLSNYFKLSLDWKVEFTVEAWDAKAKQKEFLYFGFKAAADPADPPEEIPDEDAKRIFQYAENNQAVIIQMPELRYVRLNGTQIPTQLESMRAKAKARAADALRTLSRPVKHRFIAGYLPVEISGRVTQIEYDQERVMTRIRIDQFHVPSLDQRREQIRRMGEGNYPGQQIVHSQTVQFGGSGETQPAVPVVAMPAATVAKVSIVIVKVSVDGGGTGTQTSPPNWTYTVKSLWDATLGTKMSPEWGRSNGNFSAAIVGFGYYDSDRKFHLLLVNEIEGTGMCQT